MRTDMDDTTRSETQWFGCYGVLTEVDVIFPRPAPLAIMNQEVGDALWEALGD